MTFSELNKTSFITFSIKNQYIYLNFMPFYYHNDRLWNKGNIFYAIPLTIFGQYLSVTCSDDNFNYIFEFSWLSCIIYVRMVEIEETIIFSAQKGPPWPHGPWGHLNPPQRVPPWRPSRAWDTIWAITFQDQLLFEKFNDKVGLLYCIEAKKAMPRQMHTNAPPTAPLLLTKILENFLKSWRKIEMKWRELKRESWDSFFR